MLKANTDLVGSSKRIDWGVSHHPRVMLTLTGVAPAKGRQERPASKGEMLLVLRKAGHNSWSPNLQSLAFATSTQII